jgi:hypothetical protein
MLALAARPAVTYEQTREAFGPEYPSYAVIAGRRLPLHRERRWSRDFGDDQALVTISKFEDCTATITLDELRDGWAVWSIASRRAELRREHPRHGRRALGIRPAESRRGSPRIVCRARRELRERDRLRARDHLALLVR